MDVSQRCGTWVELVHGASAVIVKAPQDRFEAQ